MKTFLIVCLMILSSIVVNSQQDSKYFIVNTDMGQFLVHGDSYLLNSSDNACGDFIDEMSIKYGKVFTIIELFDEQNNRRAVIIFDKKGNQINFDIVQLERKKYYDYYNCCIYVEELKGKLFFRDIVDPYENMEDYDCYYDSQTDASEYIIPRYYIFDPKKGTVQTVMLKNKCTKLIEDGKIICN